jgi:hypothetical protein
MGNRAVVVFSDGKECSPQVYLHWGGSSVPALLAKTRERMQGREGDLSYTAARFVGIAHEGSPGNLSLGIGNLAPGLEDSLAARARGVDSSERPLICPGDAGVFLVHVADWSVRRLSGSFGECAAPKRFVAGETSWTREQWLASGVRADDVPEPEGQR